MMRVLNISQSFEIKGGSDVYFRLLTGLLRQHGFDVEEFASSAGDSAVYPKAIDFEKPGLKEVVNYIYNSDAKGKLGALLQQRPFDLAHLHIYYGKLTASILAPLKKRKVPIIQTLHEYKLVCPTYKMYDGRSVCHDCRNNRFYQCLIKKCNRNSYVRSGLSVLESYISLWLGSQDKIDHFITVSDFQQRQLREMGFTKDNVTTVHNFISLEGMPTSYKQGQYILYFGRIEKEKGLEWLLDAMEILPQEVRLVIAGDGSYRNEMLDRIERSSQLKRQVNYLGFKAKSELTSVLEAARFVVVPSVWFETFGLTVVEGMGYHKPVIGASIGGITEIISNGKDGYLVEPGNREDLAAKMLQLWSDDALVENMGKAAREKVASQFSPEAHFQQLQSIYHQYRK